MTQDDVIEMARQAGVRDDERIFEFSQYKYLERFVNLVAAKEREACAKVAERFEPDEKTSYVTYASTAIRARGQA